MTIQTYTNLAKQPLERLLHDHGAGVFRFLRSMVGDEDWARDLVQDTFLKLQPRADEAGTALVYTIARSCAIDHLRRRRTNNQRSAQVDLQIVANQPGKGQDRPDRILENKSLRNDLLQALAELPEDQRSVFHLSEIEGLSYEEIAKILDVSPGTIASRKHHAVRKLRSQLRSQGHGE